MNMAFICMSMSASKSTELSFTMQMLLFTFVVKYSLRGGIQADRGSLASLRPWWWTFTHCEQPWRTSASMTRSRLS